MRIRPLRQLTWGLLLLSVAQAQSPVWRHLADYTETRAMIALDDALATASTRGAALFTPTSGSWEHLSITQGMLAVDLVDLCTDGQGQLFWCGADASISSVSLADGSWSRGFLEFRGHDQIRAVNDLWGGNGLVMASHSTGITLFDYLPEHDEFLVRWNLHQLGTLPSQTEVLASAALDSTLVAVTAQGLAWGRGWPDNPGSFQILSVPGSLNTISKAWLASGSGRLFVLVGDAQGQGWLGSVDSAGQWREEVGSLGNPQALAVDGAHWALAVAEGAASRVLMEDGTSLLLPQAVGALSYLQGELWAAILPGSLGGGMARVLDDGTVGPVSRPQVPGAEDFVDLDFAPDGSLWVAGVAADMERNGLYHRSATGEWDAWKLGYGAFGNYPTSLACDARGGVWFGSWGQGLGRLDPTDGQVLRFSYDASSTQRMVGFSNSQVGEGATFPLVSDVEADASGNIWVVNHQALDDSCLVVVPAAWQNDHSTAFARHAFPQYGLRFPWSILPTQGMGVWAGVAGKDSRDEEKRLLRLNPRGLPPSRLAEWRLDEHELADATWNFGLSAPGTVAALAEDDGNLWIATSDGFYVGGIYGGVAQFSRVQFIQGLISEQLAAVGLDGRGRVWVGADEGLSVFDPGRAVFQDPAALDLFSSMVRDVDGFALHAVAVDPATGELWVASSQGLFVCTGLAVDYGASPGDEVHIYPNPFRPTGDSRARLLPSSLSNDATLSVMDLSGRVLRRLNLQETEAGWDGRDQQGQLVESGVYLLLVSGSGGSAQGKVAVIR